MCAVAEGLTPSDLSDLSDVSEPDVATREGSQTQATECQVEPVQQKFKAVINSAFLASEEDVEEHGLKLETGGFLEVLTRASWRP